MKKITIIILAFAIIMSFGACSKSSSASASKTTQSSSAQNSSSKGAEKDTNSAKSTTKSASTTEKATANTEDIKKGTSTKTEYINKSLGIKIVAPKGWSISSAKEIAKEDKNRTLPVDKSNDCMLYKITEIKTGYDVKSVSVSISKSAKLNSLSAWSQHMKKICNSDTSYMEFVEKGYITIGGRQYLKAVTEYKNDSEFNVFYLATVQNGTLAIIDLSPFDEKEAEQFIKTNIIEL